MAVSSYCGTLEPVFLSNAGICSERNAADTEYDFSKILPIERDDIWVLGIAGKAYIHTEGGYSTHPRGLTRLQGRCPTQHQTGWLVPVIAHTMSN